MRGVDSETVEDRTVTKRATYRHDRRRTSAFLMAFVRRLRVLVVANFEFDDHAVLVAKWPTGNGERTFDHRCVEYS
jgi:hypothetical protein